MFKSVTAMKLSCDRTGQTDRRTQPFIVKDTMPKKMLKMIFYISFLNFSRIAGQEVATEQNPEKFLTNIIGKKTFMEQLNILKTSWIITKFDEIILNTIKKFIFLLLA